MSDDFSFQDMPITAENLPVMVEQLRLAVAIGHPYNCSITKANVGKWSMSRLWRSWMASVAKYMADNGAVMQLWPGSDRTRPYNEDDAHAAFTELLLGSDENGNRYSWAKSRRGAKGKPLAPKSKRVYAMQKMEVWMVERGIKYLNPAGDNEYRKLVEAQDGQD